MDNLLNVLMELDDSIDWENETALISDQILDSFSIVSLIAEIETVFDIRIEAKEMVPENFNSLASMQAMISRLQAE
ncbi:MAG: acyl carrier protein [Peptococcaceae bacterium]|nr:acyl carrier protein [Peptococcaceae bacterium]